MTAFLKRAKARIERLEGQLPADSIRSCLIDLINSLGGCLSGRSTDEEIIREARFVANRNKINLSADLTPEVIAARESLRAKGWSYREAMIELGCSYTHLAHTLTGRRESKRLLAAIDALWPVDCSRSLSRE